MADNEKLGSTSPQVLLKNAINLDKLVNDRESESLPDRFDVLRRTWFGMEKAHDRQMQSQENRFDTFIASSGYEVIGDYTAGPLTLTEYNQLIRYNNELYKLTAATDIPYTTAGNTDETWTSADSLHFVSVGDAALRQNLGSSEGSSLVGHKGITLSEYLDLTKALPHVSPLWQKVRSAQADAFIIILGDSTGNSDFEWVYKWATWVATKYPTHSVRYRLFVDGSGWDAEIVMSTGTTTRSIYIDNVSVPGSTERYYKGAMRSQIYNSGRTYDLVILNYGHNEGTTVPELTIQAGFTEGVLAVKQDNPGAPVIVTAQNPRRDFPDHSARAVSAWSRVAAVHGLGIIDVYSKFIDLGVPEDLYTDFIHPNAAGMDVWAGVAIEALNDNPAFQFDKIIETYTGPLRPNLAPNSAFNSWLSALPVSWSVNSVGVSRDLSRRDSFAFSVKAEVLNTASPLFYCDLSDYLFALRGQWVTFAARIWKNSGLSTNAGRLQISGTGMTAVTSRSKANEAENGWMWVICHAFLPKALSTLQIRLIPWSAVGEFVHIDRCWFGIGLMPSDIDFMNQSQVQLDDYYSPLNVGIPSGYDGTLAVDGQHITVTPSTTKARVYINIEYLTVGENYNVMWERNNTPTGDVYIRSAAAGVGNIITQGELETSSSLTFTATNKTNSVLIETYGLTAIDINILSVVKVS
ncbi:TPA: SGNH/GDSL hydrolase family protein [Klebsiella pneumoniae]|nr:SGNH/GDSL hydrolase family protein [Klebsiella pneumoniae]